jgi:hypothetical protein
MSTTTMPDDLRCATICAGFVNECPDCGHVTAANWYWDFGGFMPDGVST